MKKLSGNWKALMLILVLIIVANIVFLCQPVFGTYKGSEKIDQYGLVLDSELKFNDGFVSMSTKRTYPTETYYKYSIGTYERYGNRIFCIVHSVNDPSDSHIYLGESQYERNSIFSISSGDVVYTSVGAIFLQVFLGGLETVVLVRFICLLKKRNAKMKEE